MSKFEQKNYNLINALKKATLIQSNVPIAAVTVLTRNLYSKYSVISMSNVAKNKKKELAGKCKIFTVTCFAFFVFYFPFFLFFCYLLFFGCIQLMTNPRLPPYWQLPEPHSFLSKLFFKVLSLSAFSISQPKYARPRGGNKQFTTHKKN